MPKWFVLGVWSLALLWTPLSWAADEPNRVTLPQDHAYQVVLRDYLAGLTEQDYQLALEPIRFDPAWAADDEQVHRLWLLFRDHPHRQRVSSVDVLTMPAENFLLSSIEGIEHIRMSAGRKGFRPEDTAWWAAWDYPGNPYFNSQAVRHRAFTIAAVDMIMLDHLHESGTHWVNHGRRSDFLGGNMIWLTYVYHVVKDHLPSEVARAYETGLIKFLGRLTEWGPTGVNDNMDMKATVALAYLAVALDDPAAAAQARAYVARAIERCFHPAGLIRDAGGLEASYNGIALEYLAWAARIIDWQPITEAVTRSSELKSYMTLPEPDGQNYFGPSHFSMRTTPGMPNDQHALPHRDMAAAMHTDHALYLMFGGRRNYQRDWALPPREQMIAQIQQAISQHNRLLTPSDKTFPHWQRDHWYGRINYAYDFYQPGFYDKLRRLRETNSPLTLPPFARPGERFIRQFPPSHAADIAPDDRDTFLIARFDDFGVILDASQLTGYKPQRVGAGFSGGALGAFWTPAGGSVILGRMGDMPRNIQWSQWRQWPVHALTGQTASGDVFTSARVRRQVADVRFDIQGDSATAIITGPIGADHDDSRTAQNGCITGLVHYTRRFTVNPDGLRIETRLSADGTDQVTELYEILPLMIRDIRQQDQVPHQVAFLKDGQWITATDRPMDGVAAVRVQRFDGGAVIEFDAPRRVRLAPEPWQDTYMTRAHLQNLMIDLLETTGQPVGLPNVTVGYRIRPLK